MGDPDRYDLLMHGISCRSQLQLYFPLCSHHTMSVCISIAWDKSKLVIDLIIRLPALYPFPS